MGLLDDFGAFIKTPEGQGLLGAAFGGLSTAGRIGVGPLNTLGIAGMSGLQGYANASQRDLDQKREQMQTDLIKQQIDAATRKNGLINNMLAQYSGQTPEGTGAAQQALSAGSKVGDVGPTVTNAARIAQFQPAAGNPGIVNNVPVQAIAHDLAFNDGKNIGEWMYKQGVPDMQVSNGYAYDKNKLQPGYLPQLNMSQDGKTSMVQIGPDGVPVVSAPRGAYNTYGGYKNIEKATDAKYQLLPLDYESKAGPVGGSVLSYLNNGASGPAEFPKVAPAQQRDADKTAIEYAKQDIANATTPQGRAQAQQVYNTMVERYNAGQSVVTGSGLKSAADKKLASGRAETQVEREKDRPIGLSSVQSTVSGLDALAAEARAIMNDPALSRITGFAGRFPNSPGSDASNVAARLETLRSKTGFNVLQAMREASKTGGALGSVSERENTMLQNNLAALDTTQSPEAFKAGLQQIIDYVDGTKSRLASAYKDTYGTDFVPPPAPKQNAWLDRGYPNQQAVLKDARNTILRNPAAKGEVIKRLEAMGITNHGIK